MKQTNGDRPGNWQRRLRPSSRSQDKTWKDMPGTFWNCGTCGFYNFGYRTECFACNCARGNAKINKTGGPSSKPGSPARKPKSSATKAGVPPTRSGSNGPTTQDGLLTEQTLRKQIRAAKDDPVLTEILEKTLTKLSTTKQLAL
eukprot:1878955-Amphidinium_carterae.1